MKEKGGEGERRRRKEEKEKGDRGETVGESVG